MRKKDADKLVSHPTRVQIATLLVDRKMSPVEISSEIGQTLGTVAYHVRKMEKLNAIRLVDERRVRGAIEHIYTLRKSAKEPIKNALINTRKVREDAEEVFL